MPARCPWSGSASASYCESIVYTSNLDTGSFESCAKLSPIYLRSLSAARMSVLAWKVWGLVFAIASVLVGLYGTGIYLITLGGAIPIGTTTPPLAFGLRQRPAATYIHAIVSGVALIICGLQMLPSFRAWTSYRTHRLMGRIYAVCVFVGAPAALVLSTTAVGGATSTVGFAILAVLWIATTLGGVVAACTHRQSLHARLMAHSSALCFAAAMQRAFLPIAIAIGARSENFDKGFALPYSIISWACWVPNIIAVEIYFLYFKGNSAPLLLPAHMAGGVANTPGSEDLTVSSTQTTKGGVVALPGCDGGGSAVVVEAGVTVTG